ncbi:suppressor APC domain-containing protein 2-like isoform X2 [Tachypleus tridentatus]
MKQLEQERDVLYQGLEAIERARDWYQQEIECVMKKMPYFSQTSSANFEYSTDAYQERQNFQMSRIFEVNQHIAALTESTEKKSEQRFNLLQPSSGLQRKKEEIPLHMHVALCQPATFRRMQQDSTQSTIQKLKEQNKMLTQEVSKRSEHITRLEREKSSLIRELFQAKTQYHQEVDYTAFI